MESLLSFIYCNLGWICLNLGDLNNAQSAAEEALRLSKKNGEKHIEGMSWILLGRILGKKEPNQIDMAEESILKGMEILQKLRLKAVYSQGYLFLGEFYLNEGEQEKAKKNLNIAGEMFKEMGMTYWLSRTKKLMERL